MREPKSLRGQGLVEFALLLPILMLLIIGALDFGIAFYVKVVLENSAREGAYFTVYHTDDAKANGFALAKAAVQVEGQNSGVAISTADVDVVCMEGTVVNNECRHESTVVVTVRHELPMMIDLFGSGPLQLVDDVRMLIP